MCGVGGGGGLKIEYDRYDGKTRVSLRSRFRYHIKFSGSFARRQCVCVCVGGWAAPTVDGSHDVFLLSHKNDSYGKEEEHFPFQRGFGRTS